MSWSSEHVSALELCPLNDFENALHRISHHVNVSEANRTRAIWLYSKESRNQSCSFLYSNWPASSKALHVNAAPGGTGTRFLDCVMRNVGLRTVHNSHLHDLGRCTSSSQAGTLNCSRNWDAAGDFASDSPVPAQIAPLLLSHPNARILLTLRNPWEWVPARLQGHAHAARWGSPPMPCSRTIHGARDRGAYPLRHPFAPIAVLVHYAWTVCLARRLNQPVHLLNLFADSVAQVGEPLRHFVDAPRHVSEVDMASHMAACRSTTTGSLVPSRGG